MGKLDLNTLFTKEDIPMAMNSWKYAQQSNRERSSNWNHRQDYTPNTVVKMKKSHHAQGSGAAGSDFLVGI